MNNYHRSNEEFAPETVDEQLEQLLQKQQVERTLNAQLVHELHSLYEEDVEIVERARERLFSDVPQIHYRYERSYSMEIQHKSLHPRRTTPRSFSVLAAGLVAMLVVSSLLVILTLARQASTRTALPGTSHPFVPPATPTPPRSKTVQQVSNAVRVSTEHGPWGIAIDQTNGFVYVAEPDCEMNARCPGGAKATTVAKFSLADGSELRSYDQPANQGFSNPTFLALDKIGHVWATMPNSDALGELDPVTGYWTLHNQGITKGSSPLDLLFDKNGNIWFTEFDGDQIGFFNTKTQKAVETAVPTLGSRPYGITMDRHGTIWFAENTKGIAQIGMFTPTASGKVTIVEYPIDLTLKEQPHLITADRLGRIWVSDGFTGDITEFDPATQTPIRHHVATQCRTVNNCTHISGIVADSKGNIWYTDSLNGTVGYYVPGKDYVVVVLVPAGAHPHDGLAIDGYGTVWFTEQYGFKLGNIPRGIIR